MNSCHLFGITFWHKSRSSFGNFQKHLWRCFWCYQSQSIYFKKRSDILQLDKKREIFSWWYECYRTLNSKLPHNFTTIKETWTSFRQRKHQYSFDSVFLHFSGFVWQGCRQNTMSLRPVNSEKRLQWQESSKIDFSILWGPYFLT